MQCLIFIVVVGIIISGCVSIVVDYVQVNDLLFVFVILDILCEYIVEDGGLFCFYMVNSLYFDVIVCCVGDIIIVMLSENMVVFKLVGMIMLKEIGVDLQFIIGLGGNVINIGFELIQLGVSLFNEFIGDV